MNSSYRHSGVYWFSIIRHYRDNVKHLLTAKEQLTARSAGTEAEWVSSGCSESPSLGCFGGSAEGGSTERQKKHDIWNQMAIESNPLQCFFEAGGH